MARPQKNDILFSFNGTYCSQQDMLVLSWYFESLKSRCAQADVSELIDLNKSRIRRDGLRIKASLKSRQPKPFEFIACLN